MKKVRSRLDLFVVAMLSASGCFVRFFQLLRHTDKKSGLVTSNYVLSYVVYGIIAVSLVASLLYFKNVKKRQNVLHSVSNRNVSTLLLLLGIAFFVDYIHQCFNLYDYISSSAYVGVSSVASITLSAVASLVSCSYVVMAMMLVRGCNYNYKRLGAFCFFPAFWAFLRMLMIMMRIVDVKEDVESFCEFVFLTAFICFSFAVISAVDKEERTVPGIFIVSGLMTFVTSFLVALPRVLALLTGRIFIVSDVSFTPILYLVIGILSLTMVVGVAEKSENSLD